MILLRDGIEFCEIRDFQQTGLKPRRATFGGGQQLRIALIEFVCDLDIGDIQLGGPRWSIRSESGEFAIYPEDIDGEEAPFKIYAEKDA